MPDVLPPLLFPSSSRTEQRWRADLVKAGRIRLVGPRLYASVPESQVAKTVEQAWSTVVSALFPGALLSHRTALEFKPVDSRLFLTGSSNRTVEYPGLRLVFLRGPDPLEDDTKFLNLRASSLPRALLENLSASRPTTRNKLISSDALEQRIEKVLHIDGEAGLNRVRDRAREISELFGWKTEMDRLDALLGLMLGTRSGRASSAVGTARAIGEPFDAPCLARLQLLFAELMSRPLPKLEERFSGSEHIRNKAFFEAYFSNYIEGTTFEIAEAERIVFDGVVPPNRPKDAHDILGTFRIVSNTTEMRRTPNSFEDFLLLLRERHGALLADRPEARPGSFKDAPNRAGETRFVHPEYVRGTLRKGFELYESLPVGIARAIFIMFVVAEVHPFTDGNGRVARVMMNAELVAAGAPTIIIPTVFRDDYIQVLRALSRRNRSELLVDALLRAQQFSDMEFAPYPTTLARLEKNNWFREPDDARILMD